ncbi:MAG: hypothetical protein ACSHX0_10955 [Akkermansiaceae bacterium]
MYFSKKIILPLSVVALAGACAPYPPMFPYGQTTPVSPYGEPQQTIASEEQQRIEAARVAAAEAQAAAQATYNKPTLPLTPAAVKPSYPTATAVPGKPGYVFNPYTHNIVDVKSIASGKLVRDPEDADTTHKFRVP